MRERLRRCLAFGSALAACGCAPIVGIDDVDVVQSDAGPDEGGAQVNPVCLLPDTSRAGLTFTTAPDPPSKVRPVEVTVHDPGATFTNAKLFFCTSDSPKPIVVTHSMLAPDGTGVTFDAVDLPEGHAQIAFKADPNDTLIATERIVVRALP